MTRLSPAHVVTQPVNLGSKSGSANAREGKPSALHGLSLGYSGPATEPLSQALW